MSFVGTADAHTVFLAVAIVGVVALPLLLIVVNVVTSLLQRVTGIDLGTPVLRLVLLAIPVALLAASLALDRSPDVRTGQVIEKSERIRLDAQGSWSDDLGLTVRYAVNGAALPPVRSTGDALADLLSAGSGQVSTTLAPDPAGYDRVKLGDPFALRVLRLGDQFGVARPADRSTRSLLAETALGPGLVVLGVVLFAWWLRRTPLRYAPIALLALAALGYPLLHARQVWGERSDLSGATQHAAATVVDVTRVTAIDLMPTDVHDLLGLNHHRVPQPYDIVQVAFMPPGFPDTVLAVDAIDAGRAGEPAKGAPVDVVYAPDDPHGARITGQARTHYWRTTLGVYADDAVTLAGLGALVVVGAGIFQVAQRGKAQARSGREGKEST
jgi:hypothetical protein